MYITAWKDGKNVGYVRSVSAKYQRFSLTQDLNAAKYYGNQANIMHEIDNLTAYAYSRGYIFTIS